MKRKNYGFTIVELLTVLSIVALLTGILLPSLRAIRILVKNTAQKAQFAAIEQGLLAWRGDFGDFPPSDNTALNYCGAQKLSEALLGWDLLGFHPNSEWTATGYNQAGTVFIYDPATVPVRKSIYLESTENAFRLDSLFNPNPTLPLTPATHVICDMFKVKSVRLPVGPPNPNQKVVKAGTPILYYKANVSNKGMSEALPTNSIYNSNHNQALIDLGLITDTRKSHLLSKKLFYESYAIDPKVTARAWPYRPDSFLLISAGSDGI